jgi:hypothetical protein
MIARRSETAAEGDLPAIMEEMSVRQNHFFMGMGVGLIVAVLLLVVLYLLTRKRMPAEQG